MIGGNHVGDLVRICWYVGPAGFPYTIVIEQVLPGYNYYNEFDFASGGSWECIDGYLEHTDVPHIQFVLTAYMNGITMDTESPVWPVYP